MDKIVDYINVNRDRYVEQLKEYLAIPSISALPAHAADVRRCAEWTAAELARIGLHDARLMETPGHPVVYAEWLGAEGAPTILFYGHYDVQPVDPVELWTSPPFEATVRDGELYARGAVDDKGQVFMHMKAIEAHLSQTGRLPVNIKVLLEGEEEVGSANLDDFIAANKAMLGADVVVISDSPMFDRGIPSICYGLRGLAYFQIDVRGSKSDLHSGSFGGAVVNPAMALAQVAGADEGQGRPDQDSRLLRRRRARCATRSGRSSPSCRSTSASTGRSWARRSCSASRATRRSNGSGRGRPSRSTACSPASPARAPRRCCRPCRWPRSACGWCPTRTRRRSATCSRPTSRR